MFGIKESTVQAMRSSKPSSGTLCAFSRSTLLQSVGIPSSLPTSVRSLVKGHGYHLFA